MTENFAVQKANGSLIDYGNTFNNQGSLIPKGDEEINIFGLQSNAKATNNPSPPKNAEQLKKELQAIEDKNGAILDCWNDIKESFNANSTVEECNNTIKKYERGEISYEEAANKIKEFDSDQDSSLDLFSNITSAVAAIGAVAGVIATVATGGLAAPIAIAIGAGTGAITKAAFKTTDRATNEVDGDALDKKQIAQDALSGAVTGGIAVATMGTAGSAATVEQAIIGCAKTGVKTGAVSGAANYSIDCAFNDDKEFDAIEFAKQTGQNAIVGGIVGGVMGGINGALHATNQLKSGCSMNEMIENVGDNLISDVIANSTCTTSYKITSDRVYAVSPMLMTAFSGA